MYSQSQLSVFLPGCFVHWCCLPGPLRYLHLWSSSSNFWLGRKLREGHLCPVGPQCGPWQTWGTSARPLLLRTCPALHRTQLRTGRLWPGRKFCLLGVKMYWLVMSCSLFLAQPSKGAGNKPKCSSASINSYHCSTKSLPLQGQHRWFFQLF